jgi:sialic acid synthase SpsE
MEVAKRMIIAAKDVGADAIKFQTYKAEKLVTDHALAYWGDTGIELKQVDYYKQLDKFGKDEYAELFKYAKEVGIEAFSSPFDTESATMLADLDVPFIKVASCEITNLGLLNHIAHLGIPVIMSTGGATMADLHRAMKIFSGKVHVALMACTLANPATEPHLNRIHMLKNLYPHNPVGYSDHTLPDSVYVPMLAIAAGAQLYEKHFTIDKSMKISNHFFAADIPQFREMVTAIRNVENTMGDYEIKPAKEEETPRVAAARSWHAARDIKQGAVIEPDDIEYLRPGGGFSFGDSYMIMGATAGVNIKKGHMFTGNELLYGV